MQNLFLSSLQTRVWLVWTQVKAQKEVLDGIERRAKEAQGARVRPASGLSFRGSEPPGDSLLFQPLSFSNEDSGNSITVVPSGTNHPTSPGLHTSPRTPASLVKELKAEVKDVFFPPLRPEAKKRLDRKPSNHSSPTSRYRYIRRCFVNLTVLYVGIVFGALVFLTIAARLAAHLYEAVLSGPQSLTNIVYQSHVPTAWASVVFGTATISSIFLRHFDPASGADSIKSPMAKKRKSGKILGFMKEEKASSPQDRSRTLPPVPESVSATMGGDVTMTDSIPFPPGAESSGGDLGIQSFPSVRGKSFGENRGMKFSLSRDAKKGALILRAVDPTSHTTSQASMGRIGGDTYETQGQTVDSGNELERIETHAADLEAEQTSSRKSNRSRRRFPFISRSRPNEEFPQDVTQCSDFEQTTSMRSTGEINATSTGGKVFYATPYGAMPAPAPREKPLAPARSPPRSPGIDFPIRASKELNQNSAEVYSSRSRSYSASGSGSGSGSGNGSGGHNSHIVRIYSQPGENKSGTSSTQTFESGIDPHLTKGQTRPTLDRDVVSVPPSPEAPRLLVRELDATTPPISEADHGESLRMTEAWSTPPRPSRDSSTLARSPSSPFTNSLHSPRRPGQTSPWIAREWEAAAAAERRSTDSTARKYSLNLGRAPGAPSQSVLDLALRSSQETSTSSPVRRTSPSHSPIVEIGLRELQARENNATSHGVTYSTASPLITERSRNSIIPESPKVRNSYLSALSNSTDNEGVISAPSSPPPSGPLPLLPSDRTTQQNNRAPYVSPVRRPAPLHDLEPPPSARRNRANASGRRGSLRISMDGEETGRPDPNSNHRPRLSPGVFF